MALVVNVFAVADGKHHQERYAQFLQNSNNKNNNEKSGKARENNQT